jgi:hypothetical protein
VADVNVGGGANGASSPAPAKKASAKPAAAARTPVAQPAPKASNARQAVADRGSGLLGKGVSASAAAARTVSSVAADGANRAVGLGAGVVRGSLSAVGNAIGGPQSDQSAERAGVAEGWIRIPFATASLRLPGPGAVVSVGPVRVTLPTGALYYGGLATLAIGGSIEAPAAVGAALAGAVLGRRWLRRPLPQLAVCDAAPGAGPGTAAERAGSTSA